MKRMAYVTVLMLFFILGMNANARDGIPALSSTPHLDVFISLSMPKESLLLWQADAKRYHARLVMQGFLEDSLQKTVKALRLGDNNVLQVSIDPPAFRQYGISEVPAVVLSVGGNFDVVYGNTSLTAALATIAKEGELHEEATRLLKQAKEGHHA